MDEGGRGIREPRSARLGVIAARGGVLQPPPMGDVHRSAPRELNKRFKVNRVELLPDVDRLPIDLQVGSLGVPLDAVDALEPAGHRR